MISYDSITQMTICVELRHAKACLISKGPVWACSYLYFWLFFQDGCNVWAMEDLSKGTLSLGGACMSHWMQASIVV